MGLIKKVEDRVSSAVLKKLNDLEKNVFGDIAKKLDDLEKQGRNIMSQLDDLKTKLDANTAVTDAAGAALTKLAADSEKSFADLKAAVAAIPGGVPTDLTAAIAQVDANNTKLQAISDGVNSLDAEAIAADATTTPPPAA